jgi:hypothetical protein
VATEGGAGNDEADEEEEEEEEDDEGEDWNWSSFPVHCRLGLVLRCRCSGIRVFRHQ